MPLARSVGIGRPWVQVGVRGAGGGTLRLRGGAWFGLEGCLISKVGNVQPEESRVLATRVDVSLWEADRERELAQRKTASAISGNKELGDEANEVSMLQVGRQSRRSRRGLMSDEIRKSMENLRSFSLDQTKEILADPMAMFRRRKKVKNEQISQGWEQLLHERERVKLQEKWGPLFEQVFF